MGLISTVSYGCLSDTEIYDSTIDWKNYTDIETDNYIVQGAPNYVVSSLKHSNNPTVNSVAFDVSIQKKYTKAIVNSQGRGWLGFETIRSTGLMTGKKLTKVEGNSDVAIFQPGDAALTHYAYDPKTAVMSDELHWSDDAGKFLLTTHGYDPYGNETWTTEPAGLTIQTTYNYTFNNLVIQRIEQGTGVHSTQYTAYDEATGQVVARLDTDGHLMCLRVDDFGRTVETRMESVSPGKSTMKAADFFSQKSFVAFVSLNKRLNSPSCLLDPHEQISYDRFTSGGGKPYLTATALSFFNENESGRSEVVQVLDCSDQRSMQRSRQGVDPSNNTGNPSNCRVSWEYWKYDSRGNILFSSFPLDSAAWNNFEYQPTDSQGTTMQYDALGRLISQQRPSHNEAGVNVTSTLAYMAGGSTVSEKIVGPDPNIGSKDAELWSAPRRYISIRGKEHIIASTNQDGLISEFAYDVSGKMTSAVDPAGKRETRTYNSLGQLRILDNCYQKMSDPGKPSTQPDFG